MAVTANARCDDFVGRTRVVEVDGRFLGSKHRSGFVFLNFCTALAPFKRQPDITVFCVPWGRNSRDTQQHGVYRVSSTSRLRIATCQPANSTQADWQLWPRTTTAVLDCSSFSAAHFLGHGFGLIPAPGSFAASAFPVPPEHRWVPPRMQPLALGAVALALGCPKKMGQKRRLKPCVLQFSDNRRFRRSRSGAASSARATARSSPFFRSPRNVRGRTPRTSGLPRPSGTASRSSARGSPNTCLPTSRRARTFWSKAASSAPPTSAERQGQEGRGVKITSWSIRADGVRKLDRGEPEPAASGTETPGSSDESSAASL